MKLTFALKHSLLLTCLAFVVCSFGIQSCTKEAKTISTTESVRKYEASLQSLATFSGIDTSALVAWYDFNGGSLQDKSSYHNKIIFNNAVPTADRNGVANNAYYFGGANYMDIVNSPSLSPDKGITLFAIVKVNDFYEGKCHGNRILNKGYDDREPGDYYLEFDDGFYTHQMNCNENVDKAHENFSGACGNFDYGHANEEKDTTEFVQTGHWYHLVYTYGNGVGSFYTDGKLTQTSASALSFTSNNYDLYLGTLSSLNSQYPYFFTGSIDQIGIFNKALNAQQIAALSKY